MQGGHSSATVQKAYGLNKTLFNCVSAADRVKFQRASFLWHEYIDQGDQLSSKEPNESLTSLVSQIYEKNLNPEPKEGSLTGTLNAHCERKVVKIYNLYLYLFYFTLQFTNIRIYYRSMKMEFIDKFYEFVSFYLTSCSRQMANVKYRDLLITILE